MPPRRRAVERYGIERYVQEFGYRQDVSEFGELWHASMDYDEDIAMVKVRDPYPPNKEYWLRVPPHCSTAKAAVAWTFGFDRESDYNPVVQS